MFIFTLFLQILETGGPPFYTFFTDPRPAAGRPQAGGRPAGGRPYTHARVHTRTRTFAGTRAHRAGTRTHTRARNTMYFFL